MFMLLIINTYNSRLLGIIFKCACPKVNNALVSLIMQTIHPNHNIHYHILYCVW